MTTIEYINSKNQKLTLGQDPNFHLIDLQGIHPPKASFSTSTLAGFDGSRITSSIVNPRNILLTLQLSGNIEANKLRLYDVFKLKRNGRLIYSSDKLQIQIESVVESVEVLPMAWPVKAVISLLCPQPYFEDLQDILIDVAAIQPALSFPLELFSSGGEIGIIQPSQAQNIVNPGDISVGMSIKFQAIGTVINPKIINTLTLESLELNLTLVSGDEVIITTERGKKRIEMNHSGTITNQFNSLVLGSTFLQLDEGDNVLFTTSESGSSFLLTQITFRPRYVGA